LDISPVLYYLAALFTQLDHDLDCGCGNGAIFDPPMAYVDQSEEPIRVGNLNKLFFCRELYRRTGASSSKRVFGESCGFASLGLAMQGSNALDLFAVEALAYTRD